MVASFVERELVKPRMAQIVLLGANVGTAVTAWIVATGIEWLSPLVILAGIVLYRSGSTSRQGGGTALIGIGLMLLSLHLLSSATEPMRQSPALAAFIGLLDNAWPVALAFSAGIAFISSSSLAAVVLILSLASTGILSAGLIIVLASLASGWVAAFSAFLLFLGVHALESYILTPIIQRQALDIPPATLFAFQILLGVVFGLWGLALALPLMAIVKVIITYVREDDDERGPEFRMA